MKIIKDICYGKAMHPEQYLDIYLPEEKKFKVFLQFHGGGLESGDKSSRDVVGKYVADHGIAFVAVNYRMYPQAMYPQFICDAAEAVNWVYKNIGEYGECEGIYISGNSAGGYMSMMLCFDKKYLLPYKIPEGVIKGYIHDAGQPTTHFNILRERGIDTKKVIVDDAAPLYHIGESPDYPPMMFIVSDNDIANRYEQTQLVLSTLKDFGYNQDKIYYKLMHGNHCQYSKTEVFGEIVCEFLENN